MKKLNTFILFVLFLVFPIINAGNAKNSWKKIVIEEVKDHAFVFGQLGVAHNSCQFTKLLPKGRNYFSIIKQHAKENKNFVTAS